MAQESWLDPIIWWLAYKTQRTSVSPFATQFFEIDTPKKINMEPENHPIEKENHLPSTSMIVFQPLIFQGVARYYIYSCQTLSNHWGSIWWTPLIAILALAWWRALADHEVVEAENSLALRKLHWEFLGEPFASDTWETHVFFSTYVKGKMWVPLERSTQITQIICRDPWLGPL